MDKATEMNDIIADDDNEDIIGIYKHTFKKPFNYNGDEIKELTFDFDKLTGNDGLAIDNELMSLGKVAPVPAMNSDYLIWGGSDAARKPKLDAPRAYDGQIYLR